MTDKQTDFWRRLEVLASIAIPLVLMGLGAWFSKQADEREVAAQLQEVKVARETRERELRVAQATRERELEDARLARERDIEVARLARERDIEVDQRSRERELEFAQLALERELEVERRARERELEVARLAREREIAVQEYQLAIDVLRAPPIEGENFFRRWAVATLERNGLELDAESRARLLKEPLPVPAVTTGASSSGGFTVCGTQVNTPWGSCDGGGSVCCVSRPERSGGPFIK